MSALYLHIPFCEKKCFYCSFVVAIGQEHRIDPYLDALSKEAAAYKMTDVKSVYVGGGTPSMMDERQLERLVRIIDENFDRANGNECTVEVNPESITLTKMELLKKAGFNRISLGVQSLNEKYLKYLGRNHNKDRAVAAFGLLRQAGFHNISVDLMSSFPGQTMEELTEDVNAIARLGAEHVSVYSLTIEANSRFYIKRS